MAVPKLRMHALYNRTALLSELTRDVAAFFASGATQEDLVRHMNAEYRTANKLLSYEVKTGRAPPILEAIEDFSECIIPVAALLAESGQVELLERVIAHGVDVEVADDQGTALVRAALRSAQIHADPRVKGGSTTVEKERHRVEIMIRLLLKAGADVNATSKSGENALMSAVRAGDVELVRLLLESGARPLDRNADGLTPLHCAMLCPFSGPGSSVDAGRLILEVVQMLLSAGCDPNVKNFSGDTPLHLLVGKNDTVSREMVVAMGRLLIEHGAKIEARNRNGNTALLTAVASIRKTPCAVEAMLDLGANPNVKNNHGWNVDQSASPQIRHFLRGLLDEMPSACPRLPAAG